jgi:hypothetical protein
MSASVPVVCRLGANARARPSRWMLAAAVTGCVVGYGSPSHAAVWLWPHGSEGGHVLQSRCSLL